MSFSKVFTMQLMPVYPAIHIHSHSSILSTVLSVYVILQDPGQSLGFIPKSIPERQEPKFGSISKLFASRFQKIHTARIVAQSSLIHILRNNK